LFDRRNRFSRVDITVEKKYHARAAPPSPGARGKADAGNPVLQSQAGEGIGDLIFPGDREFGPAMDD
jgi:hypothetical protein